MLFAEADLDAVATTDVCRCAAVSALPAAHRHMSPNIVPWFNVALNLTHQVDSLYPFYELGVKCSYVWSEGKVSELNEMGYTE
jgi:hypothetical protein